MSSLRYHAWLCRGIWLITSRHRRHGLVAELDEHNAGVLIVNLDGQQSGRGPVLGPDELTRSLERKDECVIM